MRRGLLLLLSFAILFVANAGKVTEQQALQKARQFMKGKNLTVVNTKSFSRGSKSADEAFYIFNAEHKGGFVIVSGDDAADMILGYADQGEFCVEQMPSNLQAWLESYAKQIDQIRMSPVPARSRQLARASKAAIPYMIKTQWNQGIPYNTLCPTASGKGTLTGCVATAMAQVMYYYKYPQSSASIPAYVTYSKGISVPELPAVTFKWDKMKLTYNSSDGYDESVEAVSELMRYCGQSVEMDYTESFSGAFLSPKSMMEYFGYSKNAKYVQRRNYAFAEWEDMIYTELSEGRPVLYGGSSLTGGHQFICDGYDGNGFYHFNWGWGGYCDGYFVLSVANPSGKGYGGGASEDGYSVDQDAVVGVKPAVAGEVVTPYINSYLYNLSKNTYTRSSGSSDFQNVELLGSLYVYYEADGPDYAMDYGWGLFKDGQLLKVLGSASGVFNNNGYNNDVSASFGSGLSDGAYQAMQVYRPSGTDNWQAVQDSKQNFIEAVISGTNLSLQRIEAYKIDNADLTINSVNFSDKKVVGRPLEITVNLTNNGYTYQDPLYFWFGDECVTLVWGSIEHGKTGDVLMHFIPKYSCTNQTVFISTDNYGSNVIWKGTLTITTPQPYTLSASSFSVANMSDHVLTGTTLKLTATIKNESAYTYDDDIVLNLLKSFEPYSGGSITGSVFATTEQAVKIEPNESKKVTLTIPNLVDGGYAYWMYLSYYSEGNDKYFDLGNMGYIFTVEKGEGEEEQIKITAAKQVPYCSSKNLDFTDKPELKAYVATGYDKANGTIWLTRVKQVPANTGFLLVGEAGDYDIPVAESAADCYYKNMFKGTISGETIYTTDGKYTNYYLSNGDKGVGFYKVTKAEGQSIGANRCYLPILTEIPAVGSEGNTVAIKVSAALQVPYYTSTSLDFTSMDAKGVKAYTATGYNYGTGTIWLSRVKKVPAKTGVLIMANEAGDYDIPTASVAATFENMFNGSETAQTIYTNETIDGVNYVNYYLSKGDYGVGFYKVTKEDGVSMGANRCYLQIPYRSSSGARGEAESETPAWSDMIFSDEGDDIIAIPVYGSTNGEDDGTTGIDNNNREPITNNHWYNLHGQRVNNPGKGLYIRNGHKVVIK